MQATIDKLTADQTAQQAKVDKAGDEVKLANDTYLTAQKATQAIEANFNAATALAVSEFLR